ncbi:MAG: hypothetical protein A2017_14400 [Lentisphaerae bacterium GWF2_44_16]|nr:MAG: hypothetical protein A2017_14400 [Lentisphaerae bacterium GWF2_44_16]
MKILVVDDSLSMRKIIRKELEKGSYDVIEAVDGSEALRLVVSNRDIDLVTLDIQMPGMDGFRTCEELKKEKYQGIFSSHSGKSLPILFITANDSLEDRQKGFELGATDFIGKDFIETELLAAVNNILKPSRKLENLHALIAEDSELCLRMISDVLKQQGVITELAPNGMVAYEIIKANPHKFDMIITDFLMPEMNGMEFILKIRKELGLNEIPIIVLSGAYDEVNQIDIFKGGATDYINKPFIKEELLSRITVHLERALFNKSLKKSVLELKERNKEILESKEKIEGIHNEQKELLHVLCHDLVNPFGSILGITEIFDTFPDEQDILKEQIVKSAENGLEIIDMVRKMRAVEEKKLKWHLLPVNLKDALDESYMMLRKKFTDKKIIFELDFDSTVSVMAETTSLINSVFNNILTNAVKFSYPGSKITVRADRKENNFIAVLIKDTGIGMSHRLLQDIFNINKATSREGTSGETGTGFGMPLIKKFMETYGGSIEVFSKDEKTSPKDHGTTIKLLFKA